MDSVQTSPGLDPVAVDGVPPAAQIPLLQHVEGLWGEVRGILHDHLHLLALEGQRAGRGLVAILAFGVAIGVLAVSAWLGLLGALAVLLIGLGLNAGAALLGVAALNLVAVYGLLRAIRQRSRELLFPATLNVLRPTVAADPPA